MSAQPDGLPIHRVITGPDGATFCRRVSEVVSLGNELYEGPAVAFNGERGIVVAQALLWPTRATGRDRALR